MKTYSIGSKEPVLPTANSYLVLEEGKKEAYIREFKNTSHLQNSFMCNLKSASKRPRYLIPIRDVNTVYGGDTMYDALHAIFEDFPAFMDNYVRHEGHGFPWICWLYGEYKTLRVDWLINKLTPYQMPDFITLLTEEGGYNPIVNFWTLNEVRATRDLCFKYSVHVSNVDNDVTRFYLYNPKLSLIEKLQCVYGFLKELNLLKDEK